MAMLEVRDLHVAFPRGKRDEVALAARKGHVKVTHFEHRHQSSPRRSFGLSTSRIQSPRRFSARISTTSTMAG